MLDLRAVMAALAQKRPIFHSEADFQHALAWEIQRTSRDAVIRLERRVTVENPTTGKQERIYVDVSAALDGQVVAIELKYKTWCLRTECDGEEFDLCGQSAEDCGRYDFLWDVQRLERIAKTRPPTVGCALFLTNDNSYWKPPRSADTNDAAFRLHEEEGRELTGQLAWGPMAGRGTTHSREKPITLRGTYRPRWEDYSGLKSGKYSLLRYLLVEVAPPPARGT